MISLGRPSDDAVRAFLARQRDSPFSYSEVGASRGTPPAGYAVDQHRVRLGSGLAVFEAARDALRRWEMFNIGWAEVRTTGEPIAEGQVAVIAHVFGLWFLNACRIVYLVDETGPVDRFGFAYGTLPDHAERGEERFTVEWDHADDSVWYEQFAFSRPNHLLTQLNFPMARAVQRRFGRDALAAMVRAVSVEEA